MVLRHLIYSVISLAAFTVVTSDPASAQRTRSVVLATEDVPLSGNSITIDASKARGAFQELRIINLGARLIIHNLRIVYHDGTADEIRKTFTLNRKERTRVLSSGDGPKFVDKLVIDYRRMGRTRAAARIVVQGTQTRQQARMQRPSGTPRPASQAADTTPGQVDRDVLFGYRNLEKDVDRDEIRVGPEVGKFKRLRLRVVDSDVYIRDLRIDYTDGSTQSVPFGARIEGGQRSAWFDVDATRFIDKIVLIYRADPGSEQGARVEVTGQYTGSWLDPSGEGRSYNSGWVLLGAETAGTIGYDTDTIAVGENEGGFSHIRLKVRDRSVTMRELRVVYSEGSEDFFRVNRRIDPDQIVGPFRLTHEGAVIQEIVARYRTRLFFGKGKGTAVVEIWGQHESR